MEIGEIITICTVIGGAIAGFFGVKTKVSVVNNEVKNHKEDLKTHKEEVNKKLDQYKDDYTTRFNDARLDNLRLVDDIKNVDKTLNNRIDTVEKDVKGVLDEVKGVRLLVGENRVEMIEKMMTVKEDVIKAVNDARK